jgi:mevalonate kinase
VLHLVVCSVPRDAACAKLISRLSERLKAGEHSIRESIDSLGRIASEAADILLANETDLAKDLGMLAGSAMDRLRALGLSTPAMDFLLQAALAAGAQGGKLSGAGGGGALFAIAPDRSTASRIVSRLQSEVVKGKIALTSALRVLQT